MSGAQRTREVINLVDDDPPPRPRGGGGAGGGGGGGGGGATARNGGGGDGTARRRERETISLVGPTEFDGIEIVGYKPPTAQAPQQGSQAAQISAQLRQRVQALADMAARSAWQRQQQRGAGGAGGAGGGAGAAASPSPSSGAKRPRPAASGADADAGAAAAKRPSGSSGAAPAAAAAASAGATAPPPPPPPAPKAPQCCLCLDDMKNPAATPCGHVFCQACITAAVKAQHKCPTCRKQIRSVRSILRVYIP